MSIFTAPTHTLHDPDAYLAKCKGSPPIAYQSFIKLFSSLGPVAQPIPAIDAKVMPKDTSGTPASEYLVPTLEEMGYPSADDKPVSV